MTDRCEPITYTAPDGSEAVARVQVQGDLTDADRSALAVIAAAAARQLAAEPRCPDCGHRPRSHEAAGCQVRVRQDGHGRPCGCTTDQENTQ